MGTVKILGVFRDFVRVEVLWEAAQRLHPDSIEAPVTQFLIHHSRIQTNFVNNVCLMIYLFTHPTPSSYYWELDHVPSGTDIDLITTHHQYSFHWWMERQPSRRIYPLSLLDRTEALPRILGNEFVMLEQYRRYLEYEVAYA